MWQVLRKSGPDAAAHAFGAAVIVLVCAFLPYWLGLSIAVTGIWFMREWTQEQAKTGDYDFRNAVNPLAWSDGKNLEWIAPAVAALVAAFFVI
ncbi:hypothetical protein [Rhodoligotrophos ferricapiens]|uniref:hypothetical protein n=1 Tax=Rhodoligotrophos ferricapiens TaxID=3069264 RepID=UPI00315C910D